MTKDLRKRIYNAIKRHGETKMSIEHGLSLKEQAIFLVTICKHTDNPEACPINLMTDMRCCPFDKINDCSALEQWAWLPILEKRVIPEENK